MDSLKFNKIAAGFLCGALLVMAGIKTAEVLIPHEQLEANAYPVELPETSAASAVADASLSSNPVGPEPILAMLASADLAKGEKLAKKCTACHSFNEGGAAKVGPNLWNIVNAAQGRDSGFGYSAALAGLGGVWSYTELNGFLAKPKAWIEGTKMNFAGLKKPADRANMIAWMRSLSTAPAALPTEAEISAEAGSGAASGS